jgi:hypothetical protein
MSSAEENRKRKRAELSKSAAALTVEAPRQVEPGVYLQQRVVPVLRLQGLLMRVNRDVSASTCSSAGPHGSARVAQQAASAALAASHRAAVAYPAAGSMATGARIVAAVAALPAAVPAGPAVALPRHLRRRATSHNPYKLSLRLRAQPKPSLLGVPEADRCRQHRRKPSLLRARWAAESAHAVGAWMVDADGAILATAAPAASSDAAVRRLHTHVWHAKRFAMRQAWGCTVAATRHDMGSRAALRPFTQGCAAHDGSYEAVFRLDGPHASLVALLASMCDAEGAAVAGPVADDELGDEGEGAEAAAAASIGAVAVGAHNTAGTARTAPVPSEGPTGALSRAQRARQRRATARRAYTASSTGPAAAAAATSLPAAVPPGPVRHSPAPVHFPVGALHPLALAGAVEGQIMLHAHGAFPAAAIAPARVLWRAPVGAADAARRAMVLLSTHPAFASSVRAALAAAIAQMSTSKLTSGDEVRLTCPTLQLARFHIAGPGAPAALQRALRVVSAEAAVPRACAPGVIAGTARDPRITAPVAGTAVSAAARGLPGVPLAWLFEPAAMAEHARSWPSDAQVDAWRRRANARSASLRDRAAAVLAAAPTPTPSSEEGERAGGDGGVAFADFISLSGPAQPAAPNASDRNGADAAETVRPRKRRRVDTANSVYQPTVAATVASGGAAGARGGDRVQAAVGAAALEPQLVAPALLPQPSRAAMGKPPAPAAPVAASSVPFLLVPAVGLHAALAARRPVRAFMAAVELAGGSGTGAGDDGATEAATRLRRLTNGCAAWDVLVPAHCATAVWRALIHDGRCTAVGEEAWHLAHAAEGLPYGPYDYPDTPAGAMHQEEATAAAYATYSAAMPKQRLNWGILREPAPFGPAWDLLWPGGLYGDAGRPRLPAVVRGAYSAAFVAARAEAAAPLPTATAEADHGVRTAAATSRDADLVSADGSAPAAATEGGYTALTGPLIALQSALPAYLPVPVMTVAPSLLRGALRMCGRGVPAAGTVVYAPTIEDVAQWAAVVNFARSRRRVESVAGRDAASPDGATETPSQLMQMAAALAHEPAHFRGLVEPLGSALRPSAASRPTAAAASTGAGAQPVRHNSAALPVSAAEFLQDRLYPALARAPPSRQPIGFVTSAGYATHHAAGAGVAFVRAEAAAALVARKSSHGPLVGAHGRDGRTGRAEGCDAYNSAADTSEVIDGDSGGGGDDQEGTGFVAVHVFVRNRGSAHYRPAKLLVALDAGAQP